MPSLRSPNESSPEPKRGLFERLKLNECLAFSGMAIVALSGAGYVAGHHQYSKSSEQPPQAIDRTYVFPGGQQNTEVTNAELAERGQRIMLAMEATGGLGVVLLVSSAVVGPRSKEPIGELSAPEDEL